MSYLKENLSLIALLFISASVYAQEQSPTYCENDLKQYCADLVGSTDIKARLMCLGKNHEKISIECKKEVQRFFQASRQTAPPGGGPLGSIGGMGGLNTDLFSLSYEGRYVDGKKDLNPSLKEQSLVASVPVYKGKVNSAAVSLTGDSHRLSEPLTLSSGREVPQDLYRLELGMQFTQKLKALEFWSARAKVGYTGDKLNKETQTFEVMLNYFFPDADNEKNERKAFWVWFVMVSNNGPLGAFVTIPGFFYIYKTENFTGLFGVPIISLQWTFNQPWSTSVSLFGPNLKAELNYGAVDKGQVFLGTAWEQERFILTEKKSDKERLIAEEKNVELGFRKPLFKGLFGEAQVGYAFDRNYRISEELFGREGGYKNLNSDWYLKASLKAAY